jgi:MoxR-like ATPase
MGMSAIEYANRICDWLKEMNYLYDPNKTWWGARTRALANGINVPATSMDTMGKALDKLRMAKVVHRHGQGKYVWTLKNVNWNRNDPFEIPEGTPRSYAPAGNDEPELEEEVSFEITPKGEDNSAEIGELRRRISLLETQVEAQDKINENLEAKLKAVEEKDTESGFFKIVEIKPYKGEKVKLRNVVLPQVYDHVLDLATMRRNILLVGPAGCGKTHLAKLIADSLKLQFYKVGGSGGLSELHLLGRLKHNLTGGQDKFVTTSFLTAYEEGGVCLIDELDAADQNVLLALNPALDDTGKCPVPNRTDDPIAEKHKDFVCIATANTVGRGANRVYAGRNQLDEATLDRFRIGFVEMDYDAAIERAICPDGDLLTRLSLIRDAINANGLRRIMSTRFMAEAYVMLKGAKWSVDQITKAYFAGWTEDEREKVDHYLRNR